MPFTDVHEFLEEMFHLPLTTEAYSSAADYDDKSYHLGKVQCKPNSRCPRCGEWGDAFGGILANEIAISYLLAAEVLLQDIRDAPGKMQHVLMQWNSSVGLLVREFPLIGSVSAG